MRPRKRHSSRGQATVEFALVAPLVVLCSLIIVATTAICLRSLQLNDTARSIVRAAITADDPVRSAESLASQLNVQARTSVNTATGLVTVTVTQALTVPLMGKWLPSVLLHSEATMMLEPPVVAG